MSTVREITLNELRAQEMVGTTRRTPRGLMWEVREAIGEGLVIEALGADMPLLKVHVDTLAAGTSRVA